MPTASLIPGLDEALRQGSPDKHADMLRRVTDLFIEGAWRFSDEHVGLFDEVLGRLVTVIETEVRAELAARLAPVPNAPPELVRGLAHDDEIAVAGPVLRQSPRLAETDLLDVARSKGQGHLLAISTRAGLGAAVTEVLVRRGDGEVARSVAGNAGAELSEAGFATLVERARDDDTLAEQVGLRADIPPHVFRGLVQQASDLVRARLAADAGPRGEIASILAEVSDAMRNARDDAPAREAVLALHRAGKLDAAALRDFAARGRYTETVAALSALSEVPFETVERLVSGERLDPVLILGRAIGLDWPTAHAVLTAIYRRLAPPTVDTARTNFDRLSPRTAERLVQFWRSLPAGKAGVT